jgi:hypothetical protein
MPGPLTTPRDRTCPAQRTGQQPARARKTTSISSQNRMLRITIVRLLADIVNRCTLISKQKMYPPAAGAAVVSDQWLVSSERRRQETETIHIEKSPLHPPFVKGERGGFAYPRSLQALSPVTGHRSLVTIYPKWQWHRFRLTLPDSPVPSRRRPWRREIRS